MLLSQRYINNPINDINVADKINAFRDFCYNEEADKRKRQIIGGDTAAGIAGAERRFAGECLYRHRPECRSYRGCHEQSHH